MTWVPPANRRNKHTKRWHHELYMVPKSDKTGQLTRVTHQANAIIANVTFKYRVGLRVSGLVPVTRFLKTMVSGVIVDAHCNLGLIEYRVQDDDGKRYWMHEDDITGILSLAEVA